MGVFPPCQTSLLYGRLKSDRSLVGCLALHSRLIPSLGLSVVNPCQKFPDLCVASNRHLC